MAILWYFWIYAGTFFLVSKFGRCLNTGNCDVKISFDSDVDLDGVNQNIPTMLRSYHVPSPMACISDCCSDESCTNVAYSLSGARTTPDSNCFLYQCIDGKCPTKSSMGKYVYNVIPLQQNVASTKVASVVSSTSTKNTETVKKAGTVSVMQTSRTAFPPTPEISVTSLASLIGLSSSTSTSTGLSPTSTKQVSSKTVETVNVSISNNLPVISPTAPSGVLPSSARTSTVLTTTSFVSSSQLTSPISTSKTPAQASETPMKTEEITNVEYDIPSSTEMLPDTEGKNPSSFPVEIFGSKESVSGMGFTQVKVEEITSTNNSTDVYIAPPFRRSYGTLITFAVFGFMILLTTIYVISSRLQESLKNYRYRHYRKVEYLMNDHRWHA